MIQKLDALAKLARKNLRRRILAKLRMSLLVNERAAKQKTYCSKFRSVHFLSPKQIQILKLVLDDYSCAEIAKELFIAESTIQSHIRTIYILLEVRGRFDLMAKIDEEEFDLICKRFQGALK